MWASKIQEVALFEVGKKYRFKIGLADDVGEGVETVLAVDGPLIKLEGPPGHIRIVNTTAPSFHSAEPLPDSPREPFDIKIRLGDESREHRQ